KGARAPCPPSLPARSAAHSPPYRWAMTNLDTQLPARDAPIRFQIALAGGVHDMCGQRRRWRIAVPAAGAALGIEMVAQRLLVETRLRPAGLVGVGRPEARGVRRHH